MRKVFYRFIRCTLWLIGTSLLLATCSKDSRKPIMVAVSSNMKPALTVVAAAFTAETGHSCELVSASSGKLTAQIEAGAPYDLFLSADTVYPGRLYRNGFALEPPVVYAYGQLIWWTKDSTLDRASTPWSSPAIQRIAIANPETAPYGLAADEYLRQTGDYDLLRTKLVFGESIAQATQFIQSGAAQVGITTPSLLVSLPASEQGYTLAIDSLLYTPITQGVVRLRGDRPHLGRDAFYRYLFSDHAHNILTRYGYRIP